MSTRTTPTAPAAETTEADTTSPAPTKTVISATADLSGLRGSVSNSPFKRGAHGSGAGGRPTSHLNLAIASVRGNVFVVKDRGSPLAKAADELPSGGEEEIEEDNNEVAEAAVVKVKGPLFVAGRFSTEGDVEESLLSLLQTKAALSKRRPVDSISHGKSGPHWRGKRALPSLDMWGARSQSAVPAESQEPVAKASPTPASKIAASSPSLPLVRSDGFWPIRKRDHPDVKDEGGTTPVIHQTMVPEQETVEAEKSPNAAIEGEKEAMTKEHAAMRESVKKEVARKEAAYKEALKKDAAKQEAIRKEVAKRERKSVTAIKAEVRSEPLLLHVIDPEVLKTQALEAGETSPATTTPTAPVEKEPEAEQETAPRAPSSNVSSARRIWSPSRLQFPSLSVGSLFDDHDWMQAFIPSKSSPAEVPPRLPPKDTVVIPTAAPRPATPPAIRPATPPTPIEINREEPSPEGSAPRRRDSLGQSFDPESASLNSFADSLDEGFEEDPAYFIRNPPGYDTRTSSSGRAWNGELETRKLLFTLPDEPEEPVEDDTRMGVLYLQLNQMENISFQPTSSTEVTVNIRQQKADRTYEWEATRFLPAGAKSINLDFECEIPLLPDHPISLVFYFKSVPDPPPAFQVPGGPFDGSRSSTPPGHQRRNSLMSFFRPRRADDPPAPASPLKRNSTVSLLQTGPPLLVAESDPISQQQWAHLLVRAAGALMDHACSARLLEWKDGLCHGKTLAIVKCKVGFLPYLDHEVNRCFWPKTTAEYAMGVRVKHWNEALSMEGYLWQLGGDVRNSFERRYYKLHGPVLTVYAPSPGAPTVTDVPWADYDFDPATQLPLPLEQTHGQQVLTIELSGLESWHPWSGRRRMGSVSIPNGTTGTISSLPVPEAAFVLRFKDGREMVLGVDPDEVARYQCETDRLSGESSGSNCGPLATLVEWRALDVADMWKQALNEVLNGVKYDLPLWCEPLKAWRESGAILNGRPKKSP
ncbi:hypothetical protein HKX48_001051 [Thoreauomyces humboldtii]|nr:hypothetical protein HKX48_001051 [Thoreauomyces humboldtii]